MSQFLSNKYLKYRDALQGKPITDDRLCDQCDYNLKGLVVGGRCPECGGAITIENPAKDALSDAPVRVIRSLRNGFWLLVPAIIVIAGWPLSLFGVSGGAWVVPVFLALAVLLWSGGVWMLTAPIQTARGERYGFGRQSKMRIAARWFNLGWIGLGVLTLLSAFVAPVIGGGASLLLVIAGPLFVLAGLIGIVLLTILMGRLAHWCYDEFAGRWLNWAMWAVPIGIIMLFSPVVLRPLGLLICSGSLIWISGLIALALSIVSLAKSVTWSLHHAIRRAERDRALATRQFEQQESLQPRVKTDE